MSSRVPAPERAKVPLRGDHSDPWVGEAGQIGRRSIDGGIREEPGLWSRLRVTTSGLLRIDRSEITAETKLDGETLLRSSVLETDAEQIARGYKALLEVEHRRDLKQFQLRPVYSRKADRIQLQTYDTGAGTISQRTRLTTNQSSIVFRR